MRQILKANNNELSFRLKLNYNNVYARLRMLFGSSAGLFADIKTMSATTTWYVDDDADYTALSEAPEKEAREAMVNLNPVLRKVKKELDSSNELAPYADDILEVPDDSFVFFRVLPEGGYKFVLAGWGCRQAHKAVADGDALIKRVAKTAQPEEEPERPKPYAGIGDKTGDTENVSETDDTDSITEDTHTDEKPLAESDAEVHGDNVEAEGNEKTTDADAAEATQEAETAERPKKKKVQHVVLKVLNQNMKPIEDEQVKVRTSVGEVSGVTDENGLVEVGDLPYHSSFSVSFPDIPDIQERAFEVEPKVEQYDAYIRKFINYSPVLFVEDQAGNMVGNYNIKIVIAGQDTTYNTGSNGMVQLPTMQEGQTFIAIDSANYANSEEFAVTSETVRKPFRFTIKRTVKSKVGISVVDKNRKPIEGTTVDVMAGDTPCQQITDKAGRAEFPAEIFTPGDVDVKLYVPGKGTINSKLSFVPDTTEYTIQLTGKKPRKHFNWRWLLLLPLLLLLGIGGKLLYDHFNKSKVPTVAEMETGVCLIIGQAVFYADLNVPDIEANGVPITRAWFIFDEDGKVAGISFSEKDAGPYGWTGTGFLVSKDGLIATNRHVASPDPEEDLIKFLRLSLQHEKQVSQEKSESLNNELQLRGALGALDGSYLAKMDSLQYFQEQVRIYDKLLNTGDFKIGKIVRTFAAFSGTRVENLDNLSPLSSPLALGEPAGVDGNDLALLQISKKQDIPADAFVFTVPEVDLMDSELPDNYEITVLGFNSGMSMQSADGPIKPQAQHGKITKNSEKYRVQYDAQIVGGSSGSPVFNKDGVLVAVNNSRFVPSQGFNWGVRTKYLRELLDEVQGTKKKENK